MRLVRQLGERYDALQSAHHALIRSAYEPYGGVEVGTEGDAFFVVFEGAGEAVRAAAAIQRALAAHDWPDGVASARPGRRPYRDGAPGGRRLRRLRRQPCGPHREHGIGRPDRPVRHGPRPCRGRPPGRDGAARSGTPSPEGHRHARAPVPARCRWPADGLPAAARHARLDGQRAGAGHELRGPGRRARATAAAARDEPAHHAHGTGRRGQDEPRGRARPAGRRGLPRRLLAHRPVAHPRPVPGQGDDRSHAGPV